MTPIEDIRLTGTGPRRALLFFTAMKKERLSAAFDMSICYVLWADVPMNKVLADLPWRPLTDLGYAAEWRN